MFLSGSLSYHIISLGCSKNLVDSEKLNGEMSSAGFRFSEDPASSDILIINTCGFIEDAKKESIDVILDAAAAFRAGAGGRAVRPGAAGAEKADFGKRLVVTGCLSRRYPGELKRDIPEIDFIYGVLDSSFVLSLCGSFGIRAGRPRREQSPLLPGAAFAYIKIAEGCSNNCSYCAIPLIRGTHRSYPAKEILADAKAAAARGVLEVNIVAQDIAAYRHGRLNLPGLVKKISAVEGIRWIRLLYCHPDHLDDGIIGLVRDNLRVVRYLDIPFQHASKRLLRSMGRKGDAASYLRLVEKIRTMVPGIHLRSTFMVGYPGETADDFRALMDFIREAKLERVGCFAYSREEGTRAFRLGDTVPGRVKQSRLRRLMEAQRKISLVKMRAMVGQVVEVLVEEDLGGGQWIGRSEFDAPEVDGVFFLTAQGALLNTIVRAEVTDAVEYDLIGVSNRDSGPVVRGSGA